MAATKLDELWDGWANTLSDSYVRTLRLQETGQTSEASAEFQEGFLTEIKKVYSEAACTAPKRFVDSKDWSAWLRRVYALSVKANKSLRAAANSPESPEAIAEAREGATNSVRALRKCFHVLHTDTNTLKSNDLIYGFYEEVMKETPDVGELKTLRDTMAEAELSLAAKADAEAFDKAKAEWVAATDPILADGRIEPSEIESLRTATEVFHREYGERFE
ncbi:MAG: hypothetical protein H8E44_04035 [Planctomycetes bacterium]|nr:hypothetical protein [Planctomycetota bacterium]